MNLLTNGGGFLKTFLGQDNSYKDGTTLKKQLRRIVRNQRDGQGIRKKNKRNDEKNNNFYSTLDIGVNNNNCQGVGANSGNYFNYQQKWANKSTYNVLNTNNTYDTMLYHLKKSQLKNYTLFILIVIKIILN